MSKTIGRTQPIVKRFPKVLDKVYGRGYIHLMPHKRIREQTMEAVAVKQAHTPGPWFVESTDFNGITVWSQRPQMVITELGYPADEHAWALKDEAVANAALIAAAPDLLAALQTLVAAADADGWPDGWGMVKDKARAALAKAQP
jgi:hypothetical protein